MKNTRDSYWGYGLASTHPLIIHACRKLDELNIEYDIKHHQGECSMYRGGTSINFKETQDDDILKTKIITDDFNLQRINKFEHEVVIDSDNLHTLSVEKTDLVKMPLIFYKIDIVLLQQRFGMLFPLQHLH